MKIVVDGKYTYETGSFKVKKGSSVILPTPAWLLDVRPATWVGTVTALKSDYDGYCATILGVKKTKKA